MVIFKIGGVRENIVRVKKVKAFITWRWPIHWPLLPVFPFFLPTVPTGLVKL